MIILNKQATWVKLLIFNQTVRHEGI